MNIATDFSLRASLLRPQASEIATHGPMTRETIKGWGEETNQPPPVTLPKFVWLETANHCGVARGGGDAAEHRLIR